MENASKALIIAGAILLSILIIALGIYIYNQAKSAMNTDSLTSVELSTFNDPITQYSGPSVIGSSVQSLLSSLISNATTNSGSADKLPTVVYTDGKKGPTMTGVSFNKGITDDNGGYVYGSTYAVTGSTYKTQLTNLRKAIAASHNYSVSIDSYNDSGYVSQITIDYNNKETSFDYDTGADSAAPATSNQ